MTKMRFLSVAVLVLCPLTSVSVRAGCKIGLADQVTDVHIAAKSALAALLQFGVETGVCLGIEGPGIDLLQGPAMIDAMRPTVAYIIDTLLIGKPYRTFEQDGVILIRNLADTSHPTTLDTVLPEYVMGQKGSLASAEWGLQMRLVIIEDPSIHGVAGTYSDRVPDDQVGPFDEHGRTARAILTLLVSQSTGAAWVSGRCLPPVAGRACWTIFDYHDQPSALGSVIEDRIRALLRERTPVQK
jgi:hypothetical protein